jgi:hypothetical protein
MYELSIFLLPGHLAVSENNPTPQHRDFGPVQKLDALIWRIIATIMQVSIVIQLSRHESLLFVPDYEICIGTYLYSSFLRIKTVQFGWVFGSQFDKALHVDASTFQHTFGEEERHTSFHARKTVWNLGETV